MGNKLEYVGIERIKEIFGYIKDEFDKHVSISKWNEVEDKPFESLDAEALKVTDGVMSVNNEYVATTDDLGPIVESIDNLDQTVPNFTPYTEDEIDHLVWDEVVFEPKPDYTEEDIDAMLDSIDFSAIPQIGEMTSERLNEIWNEVFTDGDE